MNRKRQKEFKAIRAEGQIEKKNRRVKREKNDAEIRDT
jgi:hypothetical protein